MVQQIRVSGWRFALGAVALALLLPMSRAASAAGNTDADCLKCHSEGKVKHKLDATQMGASLHAKAQINCVDCHADLAEVAKYPHKKKLAAVDCAGCHEGTAKKHTFHPQMAAKPDQVACKDCHGSHDVVGTRSPEFKFTVGASLSAACGKCHEVQRDDYLTSEHGRSKGGEAPTCLGCHRALGDGGKLNAKQAQAKLCLSCHLDNPAVRARVAPSAGFIAAFEQSVHGRALAHGDDKAPGCADCHGSHAIKKGQDSSAQVSKANIAEACGECHADIAKQWKASIHGAALAKGSVDAPTCTTCHGEHDILKHGDPNSPVSAGNVSQKVCTPCHQSLALTRKYGLKTDRTETFATSFHGLASRGGNVEVANCASCHGAHDIKPSSDPTSSIHKSHLAETCGKCHPGANEKFAMGMVHIPNRGGKDPLLYWLSTLYLLFVVMVVGGMAGHNLLDFIKKARHRFAIRRGDADEPPLATPHRLYVRMTLNERLQHAGILLSFFTLVFTGFLLRYPDAGWAQKLKQVSSGFFTMRAPIHRVAAVVMLVACLWHVAYLALTRRGRQLLRDLLPRKKDITDAIGVMKYNVGLAKTKPKLDRFSYMEKAEYWALVWGTIVMSITGFVMWFDNLAMGSLTKRGYDVARIIHFYEAWLAFLAILVWHFYFVIFNPDAYPMNLSWLTGKLSEREMAEEHPLELEKIKAAEHKS